MTNHKDVDRDQKPGPDGRRAFHYGWLLAAAALGHGDVERMVWDCSRCSQPMTTFTLRGVAGRPLRYSVLAHRDPSQDGSYGPAALLPGCCSRCNAADGNAPIGDHAVQPWARAYVGQDVRATPSQRRALAAVEAASVASQDTEEEAASAATRLPL